MKILGSTKEWKTLEGFLLYFLFYFCAFKVPVIAYCQ